MYPHQALKLPVKEVLARLTDIYGRALDDALVPNPTISSPVQTSDDPSWIRRSNIVGINVRTVGTFWRSIHYLLTLPEVHDSIHFLPIWEPGVVGSLYGIASRYINREFFDPELAEAVPELSTVEAQLAATINVIHLSGKTVGMDVIPHTDRFSEIVLGNPSLFEWLRREDTKILEHGGDLYRQVEEEIGRFYSVTPDSLFRKTTEPERLHTLFGSPGDPEERTRRRIRLVHHIHRLGYEPVPATMGPPYRGIEVDSDRIPGGSVEERWHEYRITRPEPMSRVFGPLSRFHFYETATGDSGSRNPDSWALDFSKPRREVWDYFTSFYDEVQSRYGFDYMRGDMSHVQMRPDGTPARTDNYYDPLRAVKERINQRVPSFAYFAETFMAPAGTMAYGDEVDHLEACRAEVTLGDIQSVPVGSDEFFQRARYYLDTATHRRVTPAWTVLTGDKDDPRFDEFFYAGNELRYFCALFLVNVPSYMALGFRLRDPHAVPAPNEFYSKLYVFAERDGPKATRGPYRFGNNRKLYATLSSIAEAAGTILPEIRGMTPEWIQPPSATKATTLFSWKIDRFVFVCNGDTTAPIVNRRLLLPPAVSTETTPQEIFSTTGRPPETPYLHTDDFIGTYLALDRIEPGECRIYRITVK